jgi:flavin-dependent dehydrogenase
VIGAGPAGTAAAITAASRGLHVILVEKDVFPRYRPGETLHPGVEPLFKQLGVSEAIEKAGFLRHQGIWVNDDGTPRFNAYGSDHRGDWLGWQIPGERLDTILLERATVLGVEVMQPCQVERLILDQGQICGVQTNSGCIGAPIVIDATGYRRLLTRHLGLSTRCDSPPLLAQFGYVRGRCSELARGPLFERLPSGWQWLAQISEDLLHWTRLFPRGASFEFSYVPDQFRSLASTARIFYRDVTWRTVSDCARADYFLVGDAVAQLDPSSSHGVLRALMSGIMATYLIVGSTNLAVAARRYRQWLQSWYQLDVEYLRNKDLR